MLDWGGSCYVNVASGGLDRVSVMRGAPHHMNAAGELFRLAQPSFPPTQSALPMLLSFCS